MSTLIKSDGKLIKYTADATFIACDGFTSTNPLPTGSNLTFSEISFGSGAYNNDFTITNGDQVCTYICNTNNTFTARNSVTSVINDAIYIKTSDIVTTSYEGKYYLRSTKVWSTTRPTIDKLIKIN